MIRPGRLIPFAAVVAVVIAVLTGPAGAGDGDALRFSSRFYDITTDLERDDAATVAEHMDAVHAEYARRFSGFGKRNGEALRLWVFRDRDGYTEFLASHGIDGTGSGGMFFRRSSASGLVSYLEDRPMDSMLETLRHEGMHQFTYQRIGDDLPVWLNEGMAEWFGYALRTRTGFAMGLADPRAVARLKAAAETERLLPFADLLRMPHATWNERVRTGEGSVQYDQAWSVVQFLVYAERGRYEGMLMTLLRQLWSGVDAERAIAQTFGTDLGPMEAAWRAWLDELEPDELHEASAVLHAHAAILAALDAVGERPATPEEADAALAAHAERIGLPDSVRTPTGRRPLETGAEAWWRTPPTAERSGRPAVVRFVPDRRGRLPASVEIRGLKHRVRLVWTRDGDGPAGYGIEID